MDICTCGELHTSIVSQHFPNILHITRLVDIDTFCATAGASKADQEAVLKNMCDGHMFKVSHPCPAQCSSIMKLRIVAEYDRLEGIERQVYYNLKEIDLATLVNAVLRVLMKHKAYKPYASVQIGRLVCMDKQRIYTLSRTIRNIMACEDKLLELKLDAMGMESKNHVRLSGGGRKRKIPDLLDQVLFTRMARFTTLNGGYSDAQFEEALRAYSSMFPNLQIIFGGDATVSGPNTLLVTPTWKANWRKRWHIKLLRGSHQTSIDPLHGLEGA